MWPGLSGESDGWRDFGCLDRGVVGGVVRAVQVARGCGRGVAWLPKGRGLGCPGTRRRGSRGRGLGCRGRAAGGDLCAGRVLGHPASWDALQLRIRARWRSPGAKPGSRRRRRHGHPAAGRQGRGAVARRPPRVLRAQPRLGAVAVRAGAGGRGRGTAGTGDARRTPRGGGWARARLPLTGSPFPAGLRGTRGGGDWEEQTGVGGVGPPLRTGL